MEENYGERQHIYAMFQPKSELISPPLQLQSPPLDHLAPCSRNTHSSLPFTLFKNAGLGFEPLHGNVVFDCILVPFPLFRGNVCFKSAKRSLHNNKKNPCSILKLGFVLQGHRKRWTGFETAIIYKVLDGFTRLAS